MYIVYKTQEKTGGIRVGTYYLPESDIEIINKNIANYNSDSKTILPIIEFDIENLDKDTFYNIGIRSYRDSDDKISPMSNIFTIIPNKEKKYSVPRLIKTDSKTHNNYNNYSPSVCT